MFVFCVRSSCSKTYMFCLLRSGHTACQTQRKPFSLRYLPHSYCPPPSDQDKINYANISYHLEFRRIYSPNYNGLLSVLDGRNRLCVELKSEGVGWGGRVGGGGRGWGPGVGCGVGGIGQGDWRIYQLFASHSPCPLCTVTQSAGPWFSKCSLRESTQVLCSAWWIVWDTDVLSCWAGSGRQDKIRTSGEEGRRAQDLHTALGFIWLDPVWHLFSGSDFCDSWGVQWSWFAAVVDGRLPYRYFCCSFGVAVVTILGYWLKSSLATLIHIWTGY